jgi:AP endonuclease-1
VLYEDPPDQKTSPSGKSATLKICSWNVDGLRAWIKKKGLDVSGTQRKQPVAVQ